MDVGSAFPVDAGPLEAVEPSEGWLDDPALGVQAGAMPGAAAGNGRRDVAGADKEEGTQSLAREGAHSRRDDFA